MTSTIKVDNIQNQCGANIINESSNTITIGASGDTVSLASGASQSGFGRTGTVDWQTGSIKTSGFTAADGEGYFCNTSGGAFTVTLPSGSAGAIVAVSDYTRTFQTNNLTITPQSGEKIGGVEGDAVLSTEGQTATFVYVDSTEGWINIQETSNSVTGNTFVTATGGTISTCGNFKTHVFTGPGTFCVSQISNNPSNNTLEYLVVAGGGGGGSCQGGGGGGGGFRTFTALPGTNSPLNAPAGLTATVTGYPIAVGSGGSQGTTNGPRGGAGANSTFSTITSTGGGGGGSYTPCGTNRTGGPGGSGGGGGGKDLGGGNGGSGNTPPVSPPQGNNGGNRPGPSGNSYGAGGGAAGAAGTPDVSTGADGSFVQTGFIGPLSPSYGESGPNGRYFAGGGGGRPISNPNSGGLGGGGNGSSCTSTSPGAVNTGGGGGHGNNPGSPTPNVGTGGSGIVMIRYKFQ
jgi:hypothetical protein